MDDIRLKALAVESAIFQALRNAENDRSWERYWRNHADMLEQKFTTDHKRHYSHFTYANSGLSKAGAPDLVGAPE